MKWKWHPKFSEDSQFPSEIRWYKNTRTGFRFWSVQYSTKRSLHPPTIRISVGGIYFCDITNTGKQLCSPNEPFVVVLEKGFLKNEISPFGVDFDICNFVDLFMPKHTHYTLTKIQKVKKHNRTPLNKHFCYLHIRVWFQILTFDICSMCIYHDLFIQMRVNIRPCTNRQTEVCIKERQWSSFHVIVNFLVVLPTSN